jgi:hypothetical protein
MIVDRVDYPMPLEAAKKVGEQLMAERSNPDRYGIADSFGDYFSLCEH